MKHFRKLVGPYCFWLFILTIIPMFLIMMYAFIQKGNAITTFSFTLDNFSKFFDPIFVSVLIKSFVLGIITTVLCLLIGYPVAYAISKCKENTQTILILLITFPTWINMLMRTYAWINILSSKGIISNVFQLLGFGEVSFLYTDFAVVLGMVYDFLPFMILPIYNTIAKIDRSYIEAALDLGAELHNVFFRVILPLSMPGIVSGITMVFLPAMTNYVVLDMMYNSTYIMGSLIGSYFNMYDWNNGSVISMILLILILLLSMITGEFSDKEGDSYD